jgi:hypothetical protein
MSGLEASTLSKPPKKVFSTVPKEYWDMTPDEQKAWGLQLAMVLQQKLGPKAVNEGSS